jgi:hypothetical protein
MIRKCKSSEPRLRYFMRNREKTTLVIKKKTKPETKSTREPIKIQQTIIVQNENR